MKLAKVVYLWWKNIQEACNFLGNVLIIGNYVLQKLKLFKTKVCSEKITMGFEGMNNDSKMSLKILRTTDRTQTAVCTVRQNIRH
jgi:hypothetical protein